METRRCSRFVARNKIIIIIIIIQGFQDVVALYPHPDDVDLYVGMLMERPMAGAQVGPTAGCVITDQFIALKKGDRFWHENAGVFSDGQLSEVKDIGLAKVMCEVMEGMQRVSENPFVRANQNFGGKRNEVRTCAQIGKIDFSPWKERSSTDNATPAPTTSTTTQASSTIPGETTTKPPRPTVDTSTVAHSLIACRRVGKTRDSIIECGAGQWTNAHLRTLHEIMKKTGVVSPLKNLRKKFQN